MRGEIQPGINQKANCSGGIRKSWIDQLEECKYEQMELILDFSLAVRM